MADSDSSAWESNGESECVADPDSQTVNILMFLRKQLFTTK